MKKLLLLALILTACTNEDTTSGELDVNYIAFGHFYGFCVGEQCVEIYKLTNTKLYEDTNDTYPIRTKPYDGNFQPLGDPLFQQVKDLRSKIPSQLLATPSGTIGQPDAGDWGGIYFEISVKGLRSFWFIDKMRPNIPGYLNPFVDAIESKIQLINN